MGFLSAVFSILLGDGHPEAGEDGGLIHRFPELPSFAVHKPRRRPPLTTLI